MASVDMPVGDPPGAPMRDLFGIPICATTMEGALDLGARAIRDGRRLVFGVVNAAKIVKLEHDAELRAAVCSCDAIFADGISVVWASRLLGRPLPERVAGIDLFVRLLERANRESWSVYFLGATDEVLNEVLELVRREYPALRIAGYRNGYFGSADSAAVAEGVRATAADLLFVAMTTPKKEIFLAEYGRATGAAVCHGVGGAFDVLAEKVKRAPELMQRLGLEWFYRLAQEPGRMWKRYLVTNSVFLWMLARDALLPGQARRRAERWAVEHRRTTGGAA